MSDWPPKPQNEQQNIQQSPQQPTGQEWKLLEKVILVSVEEQRRSRRWRHQPYQAPARMLPPVR